MAKKVLVVDDELDMRLFMTTLLETNGYKALSAEDGVKGLAMARAKAPALVILDVMMPHDSGINLYREMRRDPALAHVPVIVVSAVARKTFLHSQKVLNEYQHETIAEPDGYIEKPPEPDELLELIGKLLPA